MLGSDGLKDLTAAVISACGAQCSGVTFVGGGGPLGTQGESSMLGANPAQGIAPMARPLGSGICQSADRAGAEGLVVGIEAMTLVASSSAAGAEGIDYAGSAGESSNDWRNALRLIYAGMPTGNNDIFARDCNSTARRAIVDNWDNIFHGTANACTDSHPSVQGGPQGSYDPTNTRVEPGVRHAFRRADDSSVTEVFLQQLGLPVVDFAQQAPSGSNALQQAVYRALAGSPFCNVRRPEDDYAPVNKAGSQIPEMVNVGVPSGAGSGLGLVPFDPTLAPNARLLSPYMIEQMDQDPIRRKCVGLTAIIAGSTPIEQVCGADGSLGLVLPINPPPGLTVAQSYPSIPCEDTHDFELGPAPTRVTGDPVRCPNGDTPQDGQCLLPVRTDPSQPSGYAFDCLNSGLNVPAAINDTDGNGSVYTDAPNTDGRFDADGRAYNLLLRNADGSLRTVVRPNPTGPGTLVVPLVGAFYRIHSSRSLLLPPNSATATCQRSTASEQIACLTAASPCSIGATGFYAADSTPGVVPLLVNGVAATNTNAQNLMTGAGNVYPFARKAFVNSVRGFGNLLATSSVPDTDLTRDAETEVVKAFSTLIANGTVNVQNFGLVPVPGGAPLCEDFNGVATCGDATNTDACASNPGGVPPSRCDDGKRNGDETAVDVCPGSRPHCLLGTCSCADADVCNGVETVVGGACVAGTPILRDDDNPCTLDLCDAQTGQVTHPIAPIGTACPALDACHDDGACNAIGQCAPGEALAFDDGDPCTIETCDPVEGLTQRSCAPVDGTIATVPGDALEWRYSGPDPLQTGVNPTTIVRPRAALVSGRILGEQGLALGGARVTVLNHAELGETVSQTDGTFELVVNGGGDLLLSVSKDGFLAGQRAVTVPWADYVQADDLILIQSDPLVAEVDLTDLSQPFQVVQGSQISDADGERRGIALVPAGTVATMLNADGSTEELDFMSVRITEFTVGERGPARMPATLPPLSQYTYAFEINADEAVDVEAKSISFSEPLIYYVRNFLNFPSGTPVPLGSYDREKGVWVPSPSGRVIKIVSVTAGLADVSIDADAPAETPAELAAMGITEAERAKLAGLYPVGESLWRVLLPHFTSPWDCNWGAFPPPGATPPPPSPPKPDVPDPCEDPNASTIECQNQVLRESVPIAGTPFTLGYSSQRVPGWAVGRTLDLVVTGPTVPSSLRAATLDIEVAGKTYSQVFGATPNQKTTFVWDGLDAQQRGSMGTTAAKVSVGFVYDLQYAVTNEFGYSGNGVAIGGNRSTGRVSLSREMTAPLEVWDQRRLGLGAWSLSVHHAYDPASQTVYRGDGTRQAGTAVGLAAYAQLLSTQTQGGGPRRAVVGPDGSVYVVGGFNSSAYSAVAKITPSGAVTIVAGKAFEEGFSGDNGLATNALLRSPKDLELGPDGSLYIADTGNHRIRKVTPNGIIQTIAGTTAGFSGDGGPATSAQFNNIRGLGLGADGVLYVADLDNARVRRIGLDGKISTVAGRGPPGGVVLENVPAKAVGDWLYPDDVAVEADGSLLVTDSVRSMVRRVNTAGLVSTVAGVPCYGGACPGSTADGLPATQSKIGRPEGIVTRPDRSFYVADWMGFVHYVNPEGIHQIIAGGGTNTGAANGAPARSLAFDLLSGVAVGPGGIVIPDSFHHRVITLRAAALPTLGTTDVTVASADGSEVYQFDAQGKHRTTRDAITGAIRYEFGYAAGFLVSVTDAYGNVTLVERNPSGVATAVVSPYGQRTEFAYDANGYLAAIENPLGQAVGMAYTAGGLLTSFQNARGQSSLVQYDGRGRLLSDQDAAGGSKTLTRTELTDGWQVAIASSQAGTKTLEVRKLADGREQRTTTFPDNTTAQEARALDGTTTVTLTDGTIETTVRRADPRYGIETPITSRTVRLPSGLTYTESAERTVTLANVLDPTSIATLVNTRTVNGNLWKESYDATTKTWTITTPVGRRSFRRINVKGDLVEDRTDTLLAQILAYDAKGRIGSVTQGTRQSLFSYFSSGPANGYLETSRNPLLQTTTSTRDSLGRALTQLDPGSNLTNFGWDPDGNLASVTPPGKPAHEMDYTPVNLMSEYSPPVLASLPDGRTVYEYNLARQVTHATRPDGLETDYTYDAAGRLNDIVTPAGTYHRDYYGLIPCAGCAAGRLSHLTSPDGVALDYQYDGQLLTKSTWSGAVNGAVAFAYNTDFRVKTETVTTTSGSAAYQFGFDADTLLTCASPTNCTTPGADAFTLAYAGSGTHGLPTGSTIRTVTEALTNNTVGELATQVGKVGSTTIFSETYDSASFPRDALGRIQRKAELVNGSTDNWDYTYDLAGRLQTVQLNGAAYESYTYDGNGNRLTVVKPSGTTTATYDDQDRLLTFGTWTYTYTPNGELLTKSNSATGASWAYQYDVFGNLKRVDLPSGDVIEYLVDGQNRRVGKKKNGVLQKQWLYEDQLHPVAELDGSGALVARFVFAARKNAPDLVITGGVTYRVFTDQLGSPRALVHSTTGAVTGVMRHDAWGVVLDDTASTLMPFGFAGGLYDAETGLVRFGARDYDPTVGRWVSKDPILFAGGQANIYAYVSNDPCNVTDSMGLRGDPDCIEKVERECRRGCTKACGGTGAVACSNLCFTVAKYFCLDRKGDDKDCWGWAAKVYGWCKEDGGSDVACAGAAAAAYADCKRTGRGR